MGGAGSRPLSPQPRGCLPKPTPAAHGHPSDRRCSYWGDSKVAASTAWALWGSLMLVGPHPLLWRWKQRIDRRFMQRFQASAMSKAEQAPMVIQCSAAAVPPNSPPPPWKQPCPQQVWAAWPQPRRMPLWCQPNAHGQRAQLLQSVDGFPALISDPWLNGRITALHACSDLWACGASVQSAQAVVTLPLTSPSIQQHLLAQTIAGIRSALDPQQSHADWWAHPGGPQSSP